MSALLRGADSTDRKEPITMTDPRTIKTFPHLVRTPDQIARRTLTPRRRRADPIWFATRTDWTMLGVMVAVDAIVLAVAVLR